MKVRKLIILLNLISLTLQQQCDPYAESSSPCSCQEGFYSPNASSIMCQKCPINTTTAVNQTQGDIGQCSICEEGFYVQSQASASIPVTCNACPNGSTININNNRRFLSPGNIDQGICNQCKPQYYLKVPSSLQQGSSPGVAATCVECPNNSYVFTPSNSVQTESNCDTCQRGFYVKTPSLNGQAAICSACPEGAQAPISSQQQTKSDCSYCKPGYYYSNSSGQVTCTKCPHNTINMGGRNGIDSCGTCKVNYYLVQAATQDGTAAICESCPLGSGNYIPLGLSPGSQQVCNICIQGYYMKQPASNNVAATCVQCPPNSTSLSTGVVNSISSCSCFDSQAVALSASQSYCLCKPGYGGNVSSSPNSPSGCHPCGPGQYSNQQGKCIACPAGTYSNNSSNTSCQQCASGQFASGEGNTSCKTCPSGSTNNQDFSDCKCYQGQGKVGNSISQSGCSACLAGQYQNNLNECVACPSGYYSTGSLNTSCTKCSSGKYSAGSGNITCQSCPSGSTNTDDFSDCKCLQGYGKLGSSIIQSGCSACLVGQYQNSSNQCVPCQQGYYSIGNGNTSCQPCPSGSTNTADFSDCKCLSGYGKLGASISQSGCNACLEGLYQNQSSECVACSAGYYSSGTLNTACSQCQQGQYSTGNGNGFCQSCPNGSTNTEDFTDCKCLPGYGKLGNSIIQFGCSPCLAGEYLNNSNIRQCKSCPSGSTNTLDFSDCKCLEGYGKLGTSIIQFGCKPCAAGQFANNSMECVACSAGNYSNGSSNTSCKQCQPGQYAAGNGNTSCHSCGQGSTNTEDFSGCKCFDSNSVTWSPATNICICSENYFGDASKSTKSENNCQKCPNKLTSKPGFAQTEKDCKVQDPSNSQQNQTSLSQIISLSLIYFILFI